MSSQSLTLQSGATANGNGTAVDTSYLTTVARAEVRETNGGTCTLTFQGSFDGSNWYSVGYQQVDATASPARAVAGISVTANAAHVYQILDPYPQLRAVISSLASSATLTVKLFAA